VQNTGLFRRILLQKRPIFLISPKSPGLFLQKSPNETLGAGGEKKESVPLLPREHIQESTSVDSPVQICTSKITTGRLGCVSTPEKSDLYYY